MRRLVAARRSPTDGAGSAAPPSARGELELVFRDPKDQAVAGVEVVLLDAPPRRFAAEVAPRDRTAALRRLRRALAGRADARDGRGAPISSARLSSAPLSRRGCSNAEGRIRWRDLPAPSAVRWVLVSEHVLLDAPKPRSTVPRSTVPRSRVPRRAGPAGEPPGARLELAAGETTGAEYVVVRGGSVGGILDAEDGEVRIFGPRGEVRAGLRPGAATLLSAGWRPEAHTDDLLTDGTGGSTFRVSRLRPGPKILQAHWSRDATDHHHHNDNDNGTGTGAVREHHYAWRAFRVEAGRNTDLGRVQAEAGDPLEVRIELVGTDGEPIPALPALWISFEARGEEGRAPGRIGDRVAITPDTPLRLFGLPPGRIRLTVGEGAPASGAPRSPHVLRMPRPREVALPRTTLLVLTVRVARCHPARVRIAFPPGSHPGPSEVLVRARSSGELHRQEVPAPGGGGDAVVVPLSLPPGTYDLLLWAPGRNGAVGWSAAGLLGVGPAGTGEARLWATAARGIEGTLVDPTGRPLAGGEVPVGLLSWPPIAGPVIPWEVETDDAGHFRIGGLPPHQPLLVGRGTRLPSAAPGTVQSAARVRHP